MKHNHRDGTVDGLDKTLYPRYPKRKATLAGKIVQTDVHPTGGHHSLEKCKRGAKRNVNRRSRFLENKATKDLVDGGE